MPSKDDSAEIKFHISGLDERGVDVLRALAGQVKIALPAESLVFEDIDPDSAHVLVREVIGEDESRIEITKPCRAGAVMDALLSGYKKHISAGDSDIVIGDWVLDTAYNTLKTPGGQIEKLTEKETAILKYLHAQKADVGKDELLQAVWEYAEDVETHTLETHIYRLRQKIEDDPAEPKLVLTTEKGYRLKG